jgi:hypothetical protein
LTPPGGFLYFLKIINLLNISLFTACKNNKIFDIIRKHNIIRDAVRVKLNILYYYVTVNTYSVLKTPYIREIINFL